MDDSLVDSLSALLISVERALERVPLEGLVFSCISCGSGRCREHGPPPATRDSAIQTAPVHELDPSIPHIDSDDEHEPNSQGCRVMSTLRPAKRLSDIPDYHLNAGIYLPGLHDADGRAIIVLSPHGLAKSGISPPECARILLYYSTLPVLESRTRSGVCILCLDGPMDIIDQTLFLVSGQVLIGCVILYTPERHGYHPKILPESQTEVFEAKSLGDLERYISRGQIPCWCGGPNDHDQLAWVHFFKEAERLGVWCQEVGRRLATVLSEVAGTGRCAAAFLRDPDTLKLRREAPALISSLADGAARHLSDNEDARITVERVGRLFSEVDRTVKRLEELAEKRREKLKDISRIRALEHEAEQVLSWLNHKGDEWLRKHSDLANNLPALKQQEIDFEKFYFISMRHLDKGGDLVEEAGQCSGSGGSSLRELARTLKSHLLGFTDRLEDTRERLEDASRCYYLLDRSLQWSVEVRKLVEIVEEGRDDGGKQLRQYLMAHPTPAQETLVEMTALANKLGYDKLVIQSNAVSKQCEETIDRVRAVLGWATAGESTLRRASDCDPSMRRQSDCDSSLRRPSDCETVVRRASDYDPSEWQNNSRQWQHHYPHHSDTDTDDDKHSSSVTTDGSESCNKSYDESLDYCLSGECGDTLSRESVGRGQDPGRKTLSPIPVNTHLLVDPSTALLPNANSTQTLKNKKTMLLIMREMIQTERDYVQSLEYVIDNYIPELVRDDIPQALRGQRNVIFGNIEKIYEFHSQYFLQELERCESSPLNVGQCFLKYESKFYLYALYNKNKPKSDSLMSEYGTTFFKGKQLELGDKMDLASYLLKPVQRMGKYALLLQQLMKASPRHDSPALRAAETMVRFQLRHGNDLLAMDSLRDCDVNVKEQGRLLRQNEFLVWQGKNGKKYYRHVFLFEELILFSKAKRFPDRKNLDIYIYKQSIKTSDIGLTAKVGDSSTKFEIWFRKRKPNDTYTLQAISEEVKQAWTEELSNLLWKQAMRNRELRLAEMSSMGIGNKPCLDIRPSANQISDRSISITQLVKGGGARLRNSIAVSPVETVRKRPHSIISVSSSSSSSSSSSGSVASGDHKHSQCSSTESGIVADWSPQPTTTTVKL